MTPRPRSSRAAPISRLRTGAKGEIRKDRGERQVGTTGGSRWRARICRDIQVRFAGTVFDSDAIACRRNDCASKTSVGLEFRPLWMNLPRSRSACINFCKTPFTWPTSPAEVVKFMDHLHAGSSDTIRPDTWIVHRVKPVSNRRKCRCNRSQYNHYID